MKSKLGIGVLIAVVAFLLATNPVVVNAAGQIGSAQIKNNSIKSKDIKDNQVKSVDVKDNSLRSADVADGSLKAGDFAGGELPYTRAFQSFVQTEIAVTTNTVIASLDLTEPGTYLVTGKVRMNSSAAPEIYVNCYLSDGVVTDRIEFGFGEDAGEDDYRSVGSLLALTIGAPKTITWECDSSSGAGMSAGDRRLVAVKVASLG